MFQDLSARVQQDEEVATRVRKEQDKLLQKDAEASQWAVELLAELKMGWDLRLKAEDRSRALQQRANQDAVVMSRLRGERDELCRTKERLRSEHSTAREGCDQAIQERDEARREAGALWADIGDAMA